MSRFIKTIIRMLVPSVIFLFVYYIRGLKPAIIIASLIGILFLTMDVVKEKKVNNSNVIGLMGLMFQIVSSFCSGYEKLYFVPALIQNIVVMSGVLILCYKSKSVFLYVMKEFDLKAFREVKDEEVLQLNYLWVGYCILKILSKLIGIFKLKFVHLYWVVFLFGTPLNLLIITLSIFYVKNKTTKGKVKTK